MTTGDFPIKDPRCPECGRAVLGEFVQGAEGRYHLVCAQPPAPVFRTGYVQTDPQFGSNTWNAVNGQNTVEVIVNNDRVIDDQIRRVLERNRATAKKILDGK